MLLAGAAIPSARAAEPAILYIPTEPVVLTPTGTAPCTSSDHSALGCTGSVDEVTELPAYPEAVALAEAMREALDPYDVWVTHERPPAYVPYVMLLPSDEPAPDSTSFTCVSAGINCGSRQRNDIARTRGSTMSCTNPVPLHAALYAFGRASGLEGVANPDDWMGYVPDYTNTPVGYVDACVDRVNQLGVNDMGEQIQLPLECTSLDHFACPDDADGDAQQNSHQDLLLYYGPRTVDREPPVLSNIVPADGDYVPPGGDLLLDVDIDDADPVVAVRWAIESPVLEDVGVPGGRLSICTNDVCDGSWDDATPLKATSSDWSFEIMALPLGEYTVTLEVADFHGNVAELVTHVVTVGEDPGGGESTTGPVDPPPPPPATTDDGVVTTGDVDPGTDSGRPPLPPDGADTTDGGSTDTEGDGLLLDRPSCSCRSPASGSEGVLPLLIGLLGVGVIRRRR